MWILSATQSRCNGQEALLRLAMYEYQRLIAQTGVQFNCAREGGERHPRQRTAS